MSKRRKKQTSRCRVSPLSAAPQENMKSNPSGNELEEMAVRWRGGVEGSTGEVGVREGGVRRGRRESRGGGASGRVVPLDPEKSLSGGMAGQARENTTPHRPYTHNEGRCRPLTTWIPPQIPPETSHTGATWRSEDESNDQCCIVR